MGLFGIKIWRLCEALSLLVFNKSRSNLASSLILKCSFYQYRRTFANWIQSKVEKIVDGSIGITYKGSFSASRPFALIALKFLSQSGTV